MPRRAEANERIRREQRAKILRAAKAVVARQGFATTVDDVAVAAGVSHGLAYRYFASKDALFQALAEEALAEAADAPDLANPPGTPGQRLDHLLARLIRTRRERPELFQLLRHVLSDPSTPRGLQELAVRRGQEFRGILRDLIVQGQMSGEVAADDPEQLIGAVVACLDGLARLALTDPGSFPSPDIISRMLRAPGVQGGA